MKVSNLALLVIMSFMVSLISCAKFYPEGFLSSACGASTNITDDWISDTPFTRSRTPGTVNASATDWQRNIFAYFTNLAANKYCYLIPVNPGMLYLVRIHFYSGALKSGIPVATIFDLFINGIKWTRVSLKNVGPDFFVSHEIILGARSDGLSLCLARNSETEKKSYVFISKIALRPLNSSLYNLSNFNNDALVLVRRSGFGLEDANGIWFPNDSFDRIWHPYSSPSTYVNISRPLYTLEMGLPNQPPVAVLQTAITTQQVDDLVLSYRVPTANEGGYYYFALYFCNKKEANLSLPNRFKIFINNYGVKDWLQFTSFEQCLVVQRNLEFGRIGSVYITLRPGEGSVTGPFINAAEVFQIRDIRNMTHFEDVMTIRKIAKSINVPDDWVGGDPCLPAGYACTGIVCNGERPPRVIILNLTNFGLSGNIPPIISSLTAVTHLLLGSNNLSGPIPDLSSLKNLTILQLQNNQLTGGIPRSLAKLPLLNELNLENNKLDAIVPSELNRPGLDLRVTQTNIRAVNKSSKPKNVILGCLVGGLLIIVVVIYFLWKYIHRPGTNPRHRSITQRQETRRGHGKGYPTLAVEYTEEEIKAATNNYSKLIAKGGFGSVFFGTLFGYDVAIKILSSTSNQGKEEFETEVTLLSSTHHKNLVKLIGYSMLPVGALVYEYIPCGTLKDHLYGKIKTEKPLDWNTRLKIALQAAEGLLYLHEGCNPSVIHRDIKCTNILLDRRMNAKVADFGLAKLMDSSQTHVSTRVKGTFGYLDPEYFETASLTVKSDVYSFGVVLLQLISGKPPAADIVALAKEMIACGRITELMDSSLTERYKLQSAWKAAEVAYTCVARKSIDRPTMSMVVEGLNEAVAFEFNNSSHNTHIPDMSFNEWDSDMMPSPR